MSFYIVNDDLSDIEKNEQPKNSHPHTIDIGYSKNLPNETKPSPGWECTVIHYSVKKDGYYSFILYPSNLHPNRVKVWHETNNSYRVIEVKSLPAYCEGSTKHERKDACDFVVDSCLHADIGQHMCIVIDIGPKVDPHAASNFTEVYISFSNRNTGSIWFMWLDVLFFHWLWFLSLLC